MSKRVHYVKIVGGKVKFECQDAAAKCHTYPACDCERWASDHTAEYGAGHETTTHAECIFSGWFDNAGYGAIYVGDDADEMQDDGIPRDMNREGYVALNWEDEWVEWEFAAEVTP